MRFLTSIRPHFLILAVLIGLSSSLTAQPVNDECDNSLNILIPNGGFGTGIFISDTVDLSQATLQNGETVPPSLLVAGQHQKSVWFKFHTATRRALRVTLRQPGTIITAGDVGFSVYKATSCLPGNSQLSQQLTPIETFGNSYHPCVDSGDYLIQVSSKLAANGPVFIELDLQPSYAIYDEMDSAYAFGSLDQALKAIRYEIGCHSLEGAFETCPSGPLADPENYNKTSWHTFTTPGYFDYITFMLAAGSSAYFTNSATTHTFGYQVYEGDARTSSYASLIPLRTCDTLRTNGYRPAHRTFFCGDLQPNTTYSVQLFFHDTFEREIRVGLLTEGTAATKAPKPVYSQMHADNQLGMLPYGITSRTDHFGCNSKHDTPACGNSVPAGSVLYGDLYYNLSTFFTFELREAANVRIEDLAYVYTGYDCSPRLLRLYSDSISNNCNSLDTSTMYEVFQTGKLLNCLPAGKYTLQIMGSDTLPGSRNYFYYHDLQTNNNPNACWWRNLGRQIDLKITVEPVQQDHRFSLHQAGAFDSIDGMQPLSLNAPYISTADTFGCINSVLPGASVCAPGYTKAMYRQFIVADSGSIRLTNLNQQSRNPVTNASNSYLRYMLFRGDANAMAMAQNTWGYPDTIAGLESLTPCFKYNDFYPHYDSIDVCVTPGTYTLVTFAEVDHAGRSDAAGIRLLPYSTLHHSPATAQNMGDILDSIGNPNGGSIRSDLDYFSCKSNVDSINGFAPCHGATKAIYREFYLSRAAAVQIVRTSYYYNDGTLALFSGRVSTQGLNGIENIWSCFTSRRTDNCETLPAGWYTVVSFGNGSSYERPNYNDDITGGETGEPDQFTINISFDCGGPQYNRPHKAAVDNSTQAPFRIDWDATGASDAYPQTSRTYPLPTEYFNCTVDTPFSSHPIEACLPAHNRVVYYVFEIVQESYLIAYASLYTQIYRGDVRQDSTSVLNGIPLQACMNNEGRIEICKIQPGVYTMVIFATNNQVCGSVSPRLYVDKIGISRFDHAANAYDFGFIPADNQYHDGKTGEVNPLHSGRAASNDFFYCSTGAQSSDPTEGGSCHTLLNERIYNQPDTNNVLYPAHTSNTYIARRNLWYTFQLDKPGWITVKVEHKTSDKTAQLRFAVYRSDVDGTIPFDQVVSNGLVDSTTAQGLSYISNNIIPGTVNCNGYNEISFFVEPCNFQPQRYYVIVDNRNPSSWGYAPANNNMAPNHQVEVSIKVDSVSVPPTLFDYYVTAGDIGTIGSGQSYFGPEDDFTCATTTPPYPSTLPGNCSPKTLWYKFTVDSGVTGTAHVRMWLDSSVYAPLYNTEHIRWYREVHPGDSTATGLSEINTGYTNTGGSYWRTSCVSQGTYYIVLTGCGRIDEKVYPEIFIEEAAGDYCDAPLLASISGPGTASATLSVNCHTIGTDYGEFAATLTCPPDGATDDYKTSWFRIDVTGADTLDITTYLTENTNASPAQIQYRMMSGNCNAMQEQSCVLDAHTQNTYECMLPGNSYYIQVFVPTHINPQTLTTGTITLNLSAVIHSGECAPVQNCITTSNFTAAFDCSLNDSATFINYSIFGNAIEYHWDFGYNNAVSNAVSPRFRYPALAVADTYTVTLMVVNTDCGDTAISSQSLLIPPRPELNLGPDTLVCAPPDSLLLDATSHAGSVYAWSNNASSPTIWAAQTGRQNYSVAVSYEGCTVEDDIQVYINPLTARPAEVLYLCGPADSVKLAAHRAHPGVAYQWSTTESDSSIFVRQSGWYWADVLLDGCIVRDSFEVKMRNDTVNLLSNDTSICLSASGYTLDARQPGASDYLWQDGSTSPQYLATTGGMYWVALSMEGCRFYDTISITAAPALSYRLRDSVCFGTGYTLPSNVVVTASGTYSDTFTTASGCDSILITELVVRDSIEAVLIDTALCDSQLPFTWNGLRVTAAGPTVYTTPNEQGCDSTTILQVALVERPFADFELLPDSLCAGQPASVRFTGTLPDGAVMQWEWDHAQVSGSDPGPYTLTWNTPGIKTIRLVISNQDCNSAPHTMDIVVKQVPEVPVIELPDYACVFDEVTIATLATAPADVRYTWSVDDEIFSGKTTFDRSWAQAGWKYIRLELEQEGCSSEATQDSIYISALPEVDILITSDLSCQNDTIDLWIAQPDPSYSYQWFPKAYFPLDMEDASGQVKAIASATGQIFVTVRNTFDCENTDSVMVSTQHCCDLFVPNAFSPNGDGVNDLFRLYSNTTQSINEFGIYNRFGQRVFVSYAQHSGWDGSYNGVPAEPGTYFFYLKYTCSDGQVFLKKGDLMLIR